MLDYY